MAAPAFTVELQGEEVVIEALAAVSKEARFAQKTAIRSAARKGRSIVAKELSARHKVPQKLFRKRVRFFLPRPARAGESATARLWTGLRKGLRFDEHPKVASLLRAQNPRGFVPRLKSGHKGWFHRVNPPRRVGPGARDNPHGRGALPIAEHEIKITGARIIMLNAARKVMRTVYPDTLRRDYKRRIDKVRRRATQR